MSKTTEEGQKEFELPEYLKERRVLLSNDYRGPFTDRQLIEFGKEIARDYQTELINFYGFLYGYYVDDGVTKSEGDENDGSNKNEKRNWHFKKDPKNRRIERKVILVFKKEVPVLAVKNRLADKSITYAETSVKNRVFKRLNITNYKERDYNNNEEKTFDFRYNLKESIFFSQAFPKVKFDTDQSIVTNTPEEVNELKEIFDCLTLGRKRYIAKLQPAVQIVRYEFCKKTSDTELNSKTSEFVKEMCKDESSKDSGDKGEGKESTAALLLMHLKVEEAGTPSESKDPFKPLNNNDEFKENFGDMLSRMISLK